MLSRAQKLIVGVSVKGVDLSVVNGLNTVNGITAWKNVNLVPGKELPGQIGTGVGEKSE